MDSSREQKQNRQERSGQGRKLQPHYLIERADGSLLSLGEDELRRYQGRQDGGEEPETTEKRP